jgi:hypothetical protein
VGEPPPSPHPAAGACRVGAGRASPGGWARWPLTVPHVAGRSASTRTFGRIAGPPDCSATRWVGRQVHGSTRWVQLRAGSVTKRSPQWAVLCVSIGHAENMSGGRCPDRAGLPNRSAGRCPDRAGPPHESSLCYGPRAAEVGPGGGPGRPKSARPGASLPSSPGHGPCQSGRRWGTDGPVATTSRSAGHAGRGRATRTTPPPGPRTGRHGRPEPPGRHAKCKGP